VTAVRGGYKALLEADLFQPESWSEDLLTAPEFLGRIASTRYGRSIQTGAPAFCSAGSSTPRNVTYTCPLHEPHSSWKAPMASILVADDNEAIRTLLGQMFRADGHTIQAAADGLQALKACRNQQFDVVFCDLFMPGMEGLETIRALRKEFPQLRVVAMSGGASNYGGDLLQVARLMGAAAILEKPFKWEQVKRVLEKALQPTESDTLTVRRSYTPQPAVS
jgi:CheY-like chemotaxis protein